MDPTSVVNAVTQAVSPATSGPEALILAEIKETHKRRQAWHKSEKGLTLQIKAIQRRLRPAEDSPSPAPLEPGASSSDGGDHHDNVVDDDQIISVPAARSSPGADAGTPGAPIAEEGPGARSEPEPMDPVAFYATYPLVEARERIRKYRLAAEGRCKVLARQLPLYRYFVEPINGLGPLGFAQILGEAGDLTTYSNPAKLWKRMGVAVINGQRQRRVTGAEALEHGYSPQRRSILWNIGDALLKKQNVYKDVYDARKVSETQKALQEGLTVLPQAQIDRLPAAKKKQHRSLGHIHARAKRYTEKRLLRDLWRAARAVKRVGEPA